MNPFIPERSVFIHGLLGTSQGVKATLLRQLYPQMHIPDFSGLYEERMQQLVELIGPGAGWTLIGSSLGGLMAADFTCHHPHQVRKQILLAPALNWTYFGEVLKNPVDTPTVIYHGAQDTLIPLEEVKKIAEQIFYSLEFHVVEDDHGLFQTVHQIDWQKLIAG